MKVSPKMLAVLVFSGGLVAIAYQVYELDKFRREMWAMKPRSAEIERPVNPGERITLGELAKEHLMGIPQTQVAAPVTKTPILDTNLNLELLGTIRGGGVDEADSALIRPKGKETKRYYIGNSIEGGAVLHAVNGDSVLIRRGDKLETLRYTKDESPATAPAVKPSQQAIRNTPAKATSDKAGESKQEGPISLRKRLMKRNQEVNPQDASRND